MKELAQIAYEAYCEAVEWKSFSGDQLPTWDQQCERSPQISQAWRAAANAVANVVAQ